MRGICSFLCLIYCCILVSKTQEDYKKSEDRKSSTAFFNFGIIDPISTNGAKYDSITNHFSINLLWGTQKNASGFILSGLATRIHNSGKGLSIAGFFSQSRTFSGVQIVPLNFVQETMNGIQIGILNRAEKLNGLQSGIFNNTEKLNGIQVGMLNAAEEANGLQLGIANYSKSGGIQIGFANMSDDNDYPIGFINIIKNGEKSIDITVDEIGSINANFRSGGRYLYGIIGLGFNLKPGRDKLTFEGGIGGRIHFSKKFRVNTEISITQLEDAYIQVNWNGKEDKRRDDHDYMIATKTSLRLLPQFRIGKRFGLFAGPSLNYVLTHDPRNKNLFPSSHLWRDFENNSFKQLHIGYTAGIQYIFK